MLVALAFALLAQCRNDIPQRAKTTIDILCLSQSVFIVRGPALLQALAASKIYQVKTSFAGLTGSGILADNA